MKRFYDEWNSRDIDDYTYQFKVLVLFKVNTTFNEVEIIIHGNFSNSKKKLLLLQIVSKFGGLKLNDSICVEINEYAEKWFNRKVSKESSRTINLGKRN